MSPTTLKIEHHDPGGLLWWENLAEIAIDLLGRMALIAVCVRIDPVFALLAFLVLGCEASLVVGSLRFRLRRRRVPSVTTIYEPANIRQELWSVIPKPELISHRPCWSWKNWPPSKEFRTVRL